MQMNVCPERLLMPAEKRRNRGQTEKEGLTLEMESLLVHGDGECAVILVIDADHSSLGGREREREKGEREGERGGQSDRDTRHTPFSFSYPLPTYLQP